MINWLREHRAMVMRGAGSLLALILLLILIQEKGDGEVFSALRRVSPVYFLLAFASLLISRLFAAARWFALLRSAGVDMPYSRAVALMFTGNFSSNFLPTTVGGDVVRLGGAMQMGYDRAVCLASLVVDRLIGMAGMVLASPLGLIPLQALNGAALQSLSVAALTQKAADFVKRSLQAFSLWLKKPLGLGGALLATLGNQFFIYWMLVLLVQGMDRRVSFWLAAGMYTLTYFVTLAPISINGLGVQELSLTFLLTQLGGLSSSESATVALLTRFLFVLASLPGAFFLPSILAAMNEKKNSAAE
ncbi:MAG: flippase-like domain-containing protein [Anaerolineales bacterium]|nr:flippase-like domain-containing protein [Anaerolineales bacterium]